MSTTQQLFSRVKLLSNKDSIISEDFKSPSSFPPPSSYSELKKPKYDRDEFNFTIANISPILPVKKHKTEDENILEGASIGNLIDKLLAATSITDAREITLKLQKTWNSFKMCLKKDIDQRDDMIAKMLQTNSELKQEIAKLQEQILKERKAFQEQLIYNEVKLARIEREAFYKLKKYHGVLKNPETSRPIVAKPRKDIDNKKIQLQKTTKPNSNRNSNRINVKRQVSAKKSKASSMPVVKVKLRLDDL